MNMREIKMKLLTLKNVSSILDAPNRSYTHYVKMLKTPNKINAAPTILKK